jgi:hypothetical protein
MFKGIGCESFPGEELHFEVQGGVGRNDSGGSLGSVCVLRRADQLGDLTLAHLGDTLVPALDDLALAQHKFELFSTIAGRVELLAVREGSHVVHADLAALGRLLSISLLDDLDLHLNKIRL